MHRLLYKFKVLTNPQLTYQPTGKFEKEIKAQPAPEGM